MPDDLVVHTPTYFLAGTVGEFAAANAELRSAHAQQQAVIAQLSRELATLRAERDALLAQLATTATAAGTTTAPGA